MKCYIEGNKFCVAVGGDPSYAIYTIEIDEIKEYLNRDIAEKTARECYPEIRDFTYDILWNDLPKEVQDQLTNER